MADGSSQRALMEAGRELDRIQTRAKKLAIEHKKEIEQVTESVVVTVTAGAFGILEGRYPDRAQVMKFPISGVAAVAALGTTLTGMIHDETTQKALLAFGQGSAAAFAYGLAFKKGTAMRQAAASAT